MKIEGNHWTVRWYRHYVALGGFGRNPENLCRFLRVITIWAPLRWLFMPRSKNQPPPILTIIFTSVFGGLIIYGLFMSSVEIHDRYVKEGWAGLKPPSDLVNYFLLAIAGICLLVVTIIVWSGLYRLYKEKYKFARAGGMCPFIEVEEGILPPPTPAAVVEIIEEREVDPAEVIDQLLVACKAARLILANIEDPIGPTNEGVLIAHSLLSIAILNEEAEEEDDD